ncbi:carbon-nitrogen hydrolase family protein [Sphingopyxis sp. MWB1]|uniref:carbon-nitrogen hydrolase family protein n=1 Tax=Sphingopyxis sp. MWB1 TaxID=1537715 RepID=UPI00068B7D7B|nr:carbon-nitrogen hydrolase family protein [Sphingopyxis sp. MWB1]
MTTAQKRSDVPHAALIQMTSGIDPQRNLATIEEALGEAAAQGAAMAFLPEMSVLLDRDRERSSHHISLESGEAWLRAMQDFARRHGIWLHTGSKPLLASDGRRRLNRSHVIAADGSLRAHYDKIHMFDVDLPTGEKWVESAAFLGGEQICVVDTPLGRLGLSICFDVRFPELYRRLVEEGAELLAVPAAFTVPTGEAHWHILLRARAIETGCHILATAQEGQHEDGRATYGHSIAINPWGSILMEIEGGESDEKDYRLALVPIDPVATKKARTAIPLSRSRAARNITL